MTRSSWLFFIGLVLVVFLASVFSKHGYRDLWRFSSQVDAARERVALLEDDNQKLSKQVDLVVSSNPAILERQIREVLGWVRSDEIVYVESGHFNK